MRVVSKSRQRYPVTIYIFDSQLCNTSFISNYQLDVTRSKMVNATIAPASWADHITFLQQATIVGLPIVSFISIYIFLRIIWKVPEGNILPKFAGPKYGATDDKNKISQEKTSLCEEGDVAGDYEDHWTNTFDMVFLIGMLLYAAVLLVLTYVYAPEYFYSYAFWLMQLPKLGAMMLVSLLGGVVCRCFCTVDEKGYIITNKSSVFKVNYTRKLQHFAAYMVPLVIKNNYHGPLALGWGDFFTMLGFLVLIKPIRESSTFFMLQFNSLDRPEDRPHTLKWIIAGNIAPGLFILLFFKWLFGEQGALTFIIIFITGIGDGLAEPVGIAWGKHKYKTRGCFSPRRYTRSWEGSACVFLSGMIFPALQYANFENFSQVLLAMLILPPTMAYAEATAPHTMDTPVLMIGCGIILYALTQYVH
jgi:dolichol kinase